MSKLKYFFLLTFGLIFLGQALIFFYAPEEATQGPVQKIFYYHVSSAFAMYVGFIGSGLLSFLYLYIRQYQFLL